jgi:exonuclease SbcC
MLIAKVELENIKNYEAGSFEFEAGVTAISGPNGAGKTTIIEAIAWALFDYLPYKKEDFLRRGAKKGVARVTFVSALDGREYTVHRDTSTGYFIYDPITKMRLVEQKQQVATWLRQHLGVEPGADLKSLFVSTIGVPQGTFTVDFAEQPAKRKLSFDKVLRVDEYQHASEDLRSLLRLIEGREGELREDIARLEVEVARLDGLLTEKTLLEGTIKRTRAELQEAETARDQARRELERLDKLRRNIERSMSDASALATRIQDSERRLADISADVRRSRDAQGVVGAAADGFARYNEAMARIAELEPLIIQRDRLRKTLSEMEREQSRAEALVQSHREKVAQLEADQAELERISPLISEQQKLEARRAELQTEIGELNALARREAETTNELQNFRQEYAEVEKKVKEAEKLGSLAESVPALEQERRSLESELAETRVRLERLSERRKELKRIHELIAKTTAEVQTLAKEIEAGLEAERMASELPQLESEDQALTEVISDLNANLKREQGILQQIQGGLCPLLSEKCLNMKEGQGLDQYFKLQVGNEREQLTSAEGKRKALRSKLKTARDAQRVAAALGNNRVLQSRQMQELEIGQKDAARLDRDITGANVSEKSIRSLEQRLSRLEQSLLQAHDARLKFEKLDLLRERLEQLKAEGGAKRREFDDLKTRLETRGPLTDERDRVEQKLGELNDPRARSRMLRQSLEKAAAIRTALEELESRERNLIAQIAATNTELESFASLDLQLTTARERRAAAEKDHRMYIENKPIAELLEGREQELMAVESELRQRREQLAEIEQHLEQMRGSYNESIHAELRGGIEELINRIARLVSELNAALVNLENVTSEIASLMTARKRLDELGAQRDRYRRLFEFAEFIRGLLKSAGPFITEAHLQSVSIEANQLYREITGNPMVSLKWDMGYEIVLEEDGHERSFASLSGGEQMAAALAVRLALLKELSDMRTAFFDEPTTNMDEDRRRNLAQQIGRIKDFDQLFVISHDDAFEGFTDRVVYVQGRSASSG